jgi:hypothetical protein
MHLLRGRRLPRVPFVSSILVQNRSVGNTDAMGVSFPPSATSFVTSERNQELQQNPTAQNVGQSLRALLPAMGILLTRNVQNRGRHQRVQADDGTKLITINTSRPHTILKSVLGYLGFVLISLSAYLQNERELYWAYGIASGVLGGFWKKISQKWVDCVISSCDR